MTVKRNIEMKGRKQVTQSRDSCSNSRTKTIIVLSVTCPKTTLFFKLVDVSGHENDDACSSKSWSGKCC